MKYQVGGAVHASTYIGEFEADSPEQALEMAYNAADVSVCHQCAENISDPEVAHLWAEDENGDTTQEESDHDRLVALQKQLKAAHACIEAADKVRARWPNMREDAATVYDAARAEYERVTKGEGER